MVGKGSVLSTVAALSLVCSGCVATVKPATSPRMEVVYAVREPPPERVEIIPVAPDDDHVWVKGHWVWHADRNDYQWQPGHWQRLEAEHRAWVPGHWVQEPRGWYFVEGRFEPVVYVTRQPPSLREEVVVARPSAEHVWIKGHWGYRDGDFEWIPGHWSRPEPGFHTWVEGRWAHEPRGWFYVEGHWRV